MNLRLAVIVILAVLAGGVLSQTQAQTVSAGYASWTYEGRVISTALNTKASAWIWASNTKFWLTTIYDANARLWTENFAELAAVEYDSDNNDIIAVGRNRIAIYDMTTAAPWTVKLVNQNTGAYNHSAVHSHLQSSIIVVSDSVGFVRTFDTGISGVKLTGEANFYQNKRITRIRQRLLPQFKLIVAETPDLYQIDVSNLNVFAKLTAAFNINLQAQDQFNNNFIYIASNDGFVNKVDWDGYKYSTVNSLT